MFKALIARSKCVAIIFVMIAMVFTTAPSQAQSPQQELETMFQGTMEALSRHATEMDMSLITEGDLLVEDSGKYFAVTLPHLKVRAESGHYADIGIVAINVMPGQDADQWKMTLAIPSPILIYNERDTPYISVNINQQNFAGVWSNKIRYFTMINANYRDITVTNLSKSGGLTIPALSMIVDMKEQPNGRWSGPADLRISGLDLSDGADMTLRIEDILMTSSMGDYSFEDALVYIEQIEALNESITADGTVSTSPENILAFYNLFIDYFGKTFDSADFDIQVKNMVAQRVDKQGNPETFKLGDLSYGVSLSGLLKNELNLGFSFGFADFAMEPNPTDLGPVSEITPDKFVFDISFNKLPFKELADLGRSSIQDISTNPAMGNMVGLNAAMMLPQLLTQSGANITLDEVLLANEMYKLAQSGVFTTDLAAQFGFVGNVRTSFHGLDKVIAFLNENAANPALSPEQRKRVSDAIMALSMLQMMGQSETDSNGPYRLYDFVLQKDGQMLMNGTDVRSMIPQ
jgi:type II secretory pathway pseudopilin PulG